MEQVYHPETFSSHPSLLKTTNTTKTTKEFVTRPLVDRFHRVNI